MQLPAEGAHYSQVVSYGTYVVRRLRRAKYTALATDAELATHDVKNKGRAWDDTGEPVQNAQADRDGADDDLDDCAQHLRNGLAGRGVKSVKEAPYIDIFHAGIGYYTAARVDEEIPRYTELKQRVTNHLPAADPLRQPALDSVSQGMSDYAQAAGLLTQARVQAAMAKTTLDASREDWERLMEKIYGLLVSELGRKQAERFFPKLRGKAKDVAESGGGEG